MPVEVRIHDASTIDTVAWPKTLHGEQARVYLPRMVKEGPGRFIDNARSRMLALEAGGEVMPLVLADGAPDCTNVCSPEAHYVEYARVELGKRGTSLRGRALRRLLPMLGWTLRAFGAGRVCYVNNWLWTTNPVPALTAQEVRDLTARLAREFPDRALVFRSLNETLYAPLLGLLREAGWRGVASRKIYLLDGRDRSCLRTADGRRDLHLFERGGWERVDEGFSTADYDRMIAFYRALYLGKYPRMNVQFNAEFLRAAVGGGLLRIHAFQREGRIEAFWGDFERDGIMTPPMIGHNLDLPRTLGAYRVTMIDMVAAAVKRGSWMNLSAGAGRFKRNRGATPAVEFDMVYTAHLRLRRRFPWWVLRKNYTVERMSAMGD